MDLDDELHKLFADERLEVPARPEADRVIVAGARRIRRRRAGVVFGGGMLSLATMLAAGTAFGVSGDAPRRTPTAVAAESSELTTTTTPAPVSTTTPVVPTSTVEPSTASIARSTTTTPKPTSATSTTTSTKAKPPSGALMFGPTTVNGLRLGMTAGEAVATGLVTARSGSTTATGCQGYDWAGRASHAPAYPLLFSPKYGLVRIGGLPEAETPEGIYDGSTDDDVKAVYPDQAGSHMGTGEWVTAVPGNPPARYWLIIPDHVVPDMRLELAVQDCYQ